MSLHLQAHNLKKNIGLFSGYVWVENEVVSLSALLYLVDSLVMWHMCMEYASINIEWLYDMWMTCILCNVSLFLKQERQRVKIKEKLDKCVKEKLLFFCDILNIPVSKSATKKACIINAFAVCSITENICSANYYCCIFQFAGWALCEVIRLPGISSQYNWFFACWEGTGTADPAFAASSFFTVPLFVMTLVHLNHMFIVM